MKWVSCNESNCSLHETKSSVGIHDSYVEIFQQKLTAMSMITAQQ